MENRTLLLAGLLLAQASPGIAVAASGSDQAAKNDEIEEVLVIAEHDRRLYELAETLDVSPDSAALLKKAVGANVVTNGPISGMAQYRGLSRMRISTHINGQVISPAGPNWMDPPLSYAPAAHLESLEVHRGIASVGAGMETIGGVVDANTWQGEFADSVPQIQGRVRAGAHSVNAASLLSGAFVAASQNHRLKLSGLSERADDAEFADGTILPTEYRRDRIDLGYGYQRGAHRIQLDYGRNKTGDAGTAALPMDVASIESDLWGFGYHYAGEDWQFDGRVWSSGIDHGMTNYHLRTPPMSPGMYRRNTAEVASLGFSMQATWRNWRFGMDGHDEQHDSNIDNPNNPLFFVNNFNDAQRRLVGLFVERDLRIGDRWLIELGGRFNQIKSDAGPVDATPAEMGMPPAVALRDRFNAADRHTIDENLDLVAKILFAQDQRLSYYFGIARKTRAPSYQERYLWLPLQATAGLADGQTYTGMLELKSEIAAEFELGLDVETERFRMSPRIFYSDVSDYIQGTTSSNLAAVLFVRMMNAMNGTSNSDPLEFQNVDARLYGFDVDWAFDLGDHFSLSGVINYVRGKREDDNLYRVAPLNGFVSLDYATERWGGSVVGFFAAEQSKVSEINGEPETSGYATVNLNGFWNLSDSIRLSAGVDNLLDKVYSDHLGGINRVNGNPDIEVGDRLPGYGRNLFARFDWSF